MEYMSFNLKGDISTLTGASLKLTDKITYLRSNDSSSENYINLRRAKVWTPIDMLLIIWKSDLFVKIIFFSAVVVSVQLYRCTTWTLTKRIEKKLDGNCMKCYELC